MLRSRYEPVDRDAEYREVAIASCGAAGTKEPTLAAGRWSTRILSNCRGNILLTLAVVAAGVELTSFASHVTQRARERELAEGVNLGIITRSEVLHLWLPRTMAEWAKRQHQSRSVLTVQELQCYLELQHRRDLWYAVSLRAYRANGEFDDMTFVRRPHDRNGNFAELPDIQATAAGNPPCYPNWDLSKASVHIISDEFLEREPCKVMEELITRPAPTAEQQPSA
jgi:hypothetical protein